MQILLFLMLSLYALPAFGRNASRAKMQQNVSGIVERVLPGVVSVRTRDVLNAGTIPASDYALAQGGSPAVSEDNFLGQFLLPGSKKKQAKGFSQGSGFFFKDAKYIVTNYHVVKYAKRIDVLVHQGRFFRAAELVGFEEKYDIAVLKIPYVKGQSSLKWGRSKVAKLGDEVFSIGNPFGFGHSVSRGIVSAKNRSIGHGENEDYLQTDASVNPGNSGGPLVNVRGEVIGLNTAVLGDAQGISFAIPSEIVVKVTNEILRNAMSPSFVSKAFLGIVAAEIRIDPELPHSDSSGVVIENIAKNSPAEVNGVSIGDIILELNGVTIQRKSDLMIALSRTRPGAKVLISFMREKIPMKLELVAGVLEANDSLLSIPGIF